MLGFTVAAIGLDEFETALAAHEDVARTAMRIALNDTARSGARIGQREIERQVAFPAGYLRDPSRFGVEKFATNSSLTATIAGRGRATSLARFARGATPESSRRAGVSVRVNPGRTVRMKTAFLVRLRAGNTDGGNLGLAVRLKPGETLNKYKQVQMKNGLTLLYGPSVNQVFETVSVEMAPDVRDELASEFLRQYVRLLPFGN